MSRAPAGLKGWGAARRRGVAGRRQVRNACDYTRPYFGWPNSFFAELIERLLAEGQLTQAVLHLPREQCGKRPDA